ncbi:cache domain-containing protein [Paenibacillus sp. P25]|nr:cache domain-containing protein [Paenibacillus sp. P25]
MRFPFKGWRTILEPFRRSIRNKLIATMVLLVAVPVLFVTLLAAENTRTSVETEVIESNVSRMTWAGGYLEERFDQLNNIIYTMLINESFNDYSRKLDDPNLSVAFNAQKGLTGLIASILYSNVKYLNGIQLYVKESGKIITVNGMNSDVVSRKDIPYPFGELFSQNIDYTIVNGKSGRSFYLVRSVNRFEDHARLGGLSLEIDWRNMENTLSLLSPDHDQSVFIASGQGDMLYQPEGPTPPSILWAIG